MDKQTLGRMIDEARQMELSDGEGAIASFGFDNLNEFFSLKHAVDSCFWEAEKYGTEKAYMKNGPGLFQRKENGQISGFLVCSPDESYIEAFEMDMDGYGESGRAVFHYTSSDASRVEAVLRFIGENCERLAETASSFGLCRCKKLESTAPDAIVEHFRQQGELKPASGNGNSIGHYAVEWLNSRGWNLYEIDESTSEKPELFIPPGPVSAMEKGRIYHLLPKIEDSSNTSAVLAAVDRCIEKGQKPVYDDMNGTRFTVDTIVLDDNFAYLYPLEDGARMRVPYFNLEGTIKQAITPCEA